MPRTSTRSAERVKSVITLSKKHAHIRPLEVGHALRGGIFSDSNGARSHRKSSLVRQRIIAAASHLFSTRGFGGSSTRDIATHARANEALIFYYFGDKQSLFWTVLEEKRRSSNIVHLLRKRLSSELPEQVVFTALAQDLLRQSSQKESLLKLLLYTGLRDEEPFRSISASFFSKHLSESYALLAEYIRDRIRKGVFCKRDPLLAARGFFSLIAYHSIIQQFLGGSHSQRFSNKHVSETFAQLWLNGMTKAPRSKSSTRQRA